MSDFCCPPKVRRFGGLEVVLYQLVMPASQTPRLTMSVLADTSSTQTKKVAQEKIGKVAI
jgi:hypothetical protein